NASVAWADIIRPGGLITIHRNPTNRPAEHSCLKAIISQNCSSDLTLRHSAENFPFKGLDDSVISGISSSSSVRKRAFGSSGKRGIRHRGGAVGDEQIW